MNLLAIAQLKIEAKSKTRSIKTSNVPLQIENKSFLVIFFVVTQTKWGENNVKDGAH